MKSQFFLVTGKQSVTISDQNQGKVVDIFNHYLNGFSHILYDNNLCRTNYPW